MINSLLKNICNVLRVASVWKEAFEKVQPASSHFQHQQNTDFVARLQAIILHVCAQFKTQLRIAVSCSAAPESSGVMNAFHSPGLSEWR